MRRLALTLSGGVSLGSFQAGVIDELLHLLGVVERRAREVDRPELVLAPDVITGASAGAMTAVLAARALLHHPRHRVALHRAWVEDARLSRFLSDAPPNAVLDHRALREIADRHLAIAEDDVVAPPPYAPERLHLAFTLANLNGLDWILPVRHSSEERFTHTFFGELREFALVRERSVEAAGGKRGPDQLREARAVWRAVGETGLASGHFPLAFRPVRLPPLPSPSATDGPAPPEEGFTYVDGGLFNNEPLRPAIRIARSVDGGEVAPDRTFLLVDANLSRSSHDPDFDEEAALPATALRIVAAIRAEASANDWLRAVRTNREVAWRDRLLGILLPALPHPEEDRFEEMRKALRSAGEEVVAEKRRLFGEGRYGPDYLEAALRRTRDRHLPRLRAEGHILDDERGELATLALFLVNSSAGLDKKTELNLDVIHAPRGQTAGDRLFGFAGFLRRSWREHDYRLGRRRAHELLPGILGVEELGPFPREEVEGRELYEPRLDPSEVALSEAPRAVREEIRDRLVDRSMELMRAVGVAGGGLRRFFLRRAVRRRISRLLEL